jgi:hypothetical protein
MVAAAGGVALAVGDVGAGLGWLTGGKVAMPEPGQGGKGVELQAVSSKAASTGAATGGKSA